MKFIENINLKCKKVLLRVDYNVPIENGVVLDNNRIVASLKTINYLLENNCKIIILSHMGKIKTEDDKINNSLLPVKYELAKLIGKNIDFSTELVGKCLENKVNSMKTGDILLLENTRFLDVSNKRESNCDLTLSAYWASLADVFIFDAFGSIHRNHASTYGLCKYLDHAFGFLVKEEINQLDIIKNEEKILLLGGSKVSDKIGMISNLLKTTEKVLIGGAMCGTFLYNQGIKVGKTFVDVNMLEEVKNLLNTGKIVLPIDVITENGIKSINSILENESIFDIGPNTIALFKDFLNTNKLIVMNGTMGKYEDEKYSYGTKSLFSLLNHNKVVILGGDTGSAAKLNNFTPYYLSTGGGASLTYLQGVKIDLIEEMK